MSKYVRVEKLPNGTTQIKLFPVKPKRGYQIFFENNGASEYFNNLLSENSYLCRSYHQWVKAGSVVCIKFNNDNTAQYAEYVAILDNCVWTDEHIEDIENQLIEQVQNMEEECKLENEVNKIKNIIQTKGYATLIQTMIKQHADELTNDEIMDIQRTLTTVKEDKGLIARPTYRFHL